MSQTLQAALGDPAIAELVQAGRLHQALSYGGFGPDDLASALAASMPAKKKAPAKGDFDRSRHRRGRGRRRGQGGGRAALAEADAAQQAAEEAETAADEATSQGRRAR